MSLTASQVETFFNNIATQAANGGIAYADLQGVQITDQVITDLIDQAKQNGAVFQDPELAAIRLGIQQLLYQIGLVVQYSTAPAKAANPSLNYVLLTDSSVIDNTANA